MAAESPAWLDASYLQNILQNAENDESIRVLGITIKPATAKGENYSSDMYRVTINSSRIQDGRTVQEQTSVIVKCLPETKLIEELSESTGIFDTEMSMMSVTLPGMEKLLEKVCFTSLSAKCFHVQYEKPIHLVFEDLTPRGFRLADRRIGLDLDHFSIAIENLARFHASSVALREKDPTLMTVCKQGLLREDQSPTVIGFFDGGVKALAAESVRWNELSPQITEKLGNLSKNFFKKACEVAKYREDDFNVLNHGDAWTNNMLFRYDDQQRPIDHIFVDFQTCYYGAAAIDVVHFFGTSAAVDVRLQHRELLVQKYYDSLSSTMTNLKCKTRVPSFEELKKSLKERAFLEVVVSISSLPYTLLEKGIEINLDEMLAQSSNALLSFAGATYRKTLTQLLPYYDNLGLLDV